MTITTLQLIKEFRCSKGKIFRLRTTAAKQFRLFKGKMNRLESASAVQHCVYLRACMNEKKT